VSNEALLAIWHHGDREALYKVVVDINQGTLDV
jgi:hypothetical protein